MKKLTFITGNAEKAAQLRFHLDYPVTHQKLDLPEIQSLDLEEIATEKARAAYEEIEAPVLVEDTSLTFNALDKLPGPLIKWFLNTLGNDGLVKLLSGFEDKTARAEVCFALHDGSQTKIFKGEVGGQIASVPKGEKGFGWDPIFIPEGADKTWGEMSAEEQKQTSMRRIALAKLQKHLASL